VIVMVACHEPFVSVVCVFARLDVAGARISRHDGYYTASAACEVLDAVTCQTSHLTPHTSHLTPHTSHLTPHTSHLTPHTSHLTPRTSHLTRPPHHPQQVVFEWDNSYAWMHSKSLKFRYDKFTTPPPVQAHASHSNRIQIQHCCQW
jgi:hypothetical protein